MANRYDVNNDGRVDVADAMIVVDQVLGKPVPGKSVDIKQSLLTIASAYRDISNAIEDILNADMEGAGEGDAPANDATPEPEEPQYIEVIDYDPTAPFDRHVGNPGVFKFNKDPEDITVEDVRNACELPSLFDDVADEDIPVGLGVDSEIPHIWTAEEIGLKEGDNDTAAKANVTAMKNALAHENCVGFKLDKLYSVRLTNLMNQISVPEKVQATNIIIPRNFIIDGEVDGEAIGGLIVRNGHGNVFYTEHSLILRKFQILTYRVGSSASVFINTVNGIDKLEVDGCVFDGYGSYKDKCNYNICLYSDGSADHCPHDENWVPTQEYCINHIYVHDCKCNGSHLIYITGNVEVLTTTNSDGSTKTSTVYVPCARVVKSFRIVGNEITNIKGNGINWASGNDGKVYGDMMGYMSCPMYVAGNLFRGQDGLYRNNGWYYDGLMAEISAVYALHNTFENFISGANEADGKYGDGIATYDMYFNGQKLYYANNTVSNVVKLRIGSTGASGVLKAKGCNINNRMFDDPSVKNASLHTNVIRYYKRNQFLLDTDYIRSVWENRTPLTSQACIEEEDKITAALEDVMLIRLDTYNNKEIPVDVFTFSDNLVDAGDGCICGSVNSAQWFATKAIFDNNVFKAKKMSSKEWGNNADSGKIVSYTWLFPMKFSTYYGDTMLRIKDNKFHVGENLNVQFLLSRHTNSELIEGQVPKPSDYVLEGNEITKGSNITTKVLNTSSWAESKWETIPGTLED